MLNCCHIRGAPILLTEKEGELCWSEFYRKQPDLKHQKRLWARETVLMKLTLQVAEHWVRDLRVCFRHYGLIQVKHLAVWHSVQRLIEVSLRTSTKEDLWCNGKVGAQLRCSAYFVSNLNTTTLKSSYSSDVSSQTHAQFQRLVTLLQLYAHIWCG